MAVTVNAPLAWEQAAGDDAAMLDDLQPNILKGHARDFLTLIFLRFGEDPDEANDLLHGLAGLMKSARAHLKEVKAFKASGQPGSAYVGLGLTAAGYAALGVPEARRPADPSFRRGMRNADLNDDPSLWESTFAEPIHAVVLVGDATPARHDAALAQARALIAAHPGVGVAGEQAGLGLHNANGDGIEHFGYVDGRSQPLFLAEDIEDERLHGDGASAWDPAFALDRVIVPDPAAPGNGTAFGSYFIYRKLEQDVQAFKRSEEKLAADLKLNDRERAGAMIVGRFEDGTPLTLQSAEGGHNPVPNDFDYDSDGDGGKCPFFGHIRKLNPRGSGGFEPQEEERRHIMARRGQTYGMRADDPNDGRIDTKPSGGVGLLFMAFNADIGAQFEFTQAVWANNPGFPRTPGGVAAPGVDLVIGQTPNGDPRPGVEAPLAWGADRKTPSAFAAAPAPEQAVTLRGGEYFFMPALSFLRGAAASAMC